MFEILFQFFYLFVLCDNSNNTYKNISKLLNIYYLKA